MWAVETVDAYGREGVDIVLARTDEEAREKVTKMYHRTCTCQITSCESILAMSLAEIRGPLGETNYFETYREREDGTSKSVRTCPN